MNEEKVVELKKQVSLSVGKVYISLFTTI